MGAARDLRRAVWFSSRSVRYSFPFAWRALRRRPVTIDAAARSLTAFLEGGGAASVKLGQYLAIRADLLPPEVCRQLETLFGDVAPGDARAVRRAVEQELGMPLRAAFREFADEPFAAASIAQVHRAVTADGEPVAVKVLRPGVEEELAADLRILRRVASALDAFQVLGHIEATALVDEFAEYTRRELDLLAEARTARRIAARLPEGASCPSVRWDLTTRRVLTMELVRGVRLSDVAAAADQGVEDPFLRLLGVRGEDVMNRLATACLKQLFVDGYFHGDPHPANILIRPDGTVVFVDFGIAGFLSEQQRRVVAGYVGNLAAGRIDAAYRHYLSLVEPSARTDLRSFRAETRAIMHRWRESSGDESLPPGERITARYQGEIFDVMRRRSVRMRQNQLLFWRALAVLDATAQRMPGRFDLLDAISSFFRDYFVDQVFRDVTVATQSAAQRPLPGRTGEGLGVMTQDSGRRSHDGPVVAAALALTGTAAAVALTAHGVAGSVALMTVALAAVLNGFYRSTKRARSSR